MLEMEINFCPQCLEKIINPKLKEFWHKLCISSIVKDKWVEYSYLNTLDMQFLSILEDKKLLITTEDLTSIYAKPTEIYITEHDDIVICSDSGYHLSDLTLVRS